MPTCKEQISVPEYEALGSQDGVGSQQVETNFGSAQPRALRSGQAGVHTGRQLQQNGRLVLSVERVRT